MKLLYNWSIPSFRRSICPWSAFIDLSDLVSSFGINLKLHFPSWFIQLLKKYILKQKDNLRIIIVKVLRTLDSRHWNIFSSFARILKTKTIQPFFITAKKGRSIAEGVYLLHFPLDKAYVRVFTLHIHICIITYIWFYVQVYTLIIGIIDNYCIAL